MNMARLLLGLLWEPFLCEFVKYIAEENYKNYKQSYCVSGQFGCKIKNPIFITKSESEESQKIEVISKDEIGNEINILLGELPDRTTATEMYEKLKKKKNVLNKEN